MSCRLDLILLTIAVIVSSVIGSYGQNTNFHNTREQTLAREVQTLNNYITNSMKIENGSVLPMVDVLDLTLPLLVGDDMPLPDVIVPNAPFINVNVSLGGCFNLNGGVRFSAAIGFSKQIKIGRTTFMPAVNLAGNVYNYGVGTKRLNDKDVTDLPELHLDGVMSISSTIGWGGLARKAIPLNTFTNNTATAIENPFYNSFTLASNIVKNSHGRNQRVGYFGGKIKGRLGLNTYNDVFPFIGDGDDRYWSGVGSIQYVLNDDYVFTLGSDIFTEERIAINKQAKEFEHDHNNPANGSVGTFYQTRLQRLYNDGQTYISLEGNRNFNVRYLGEIHMKPQWVVHNNFTKDALFYYERP